MRAFAVAYEPLHLHTFVFLCLGFAGQPAARALQARSRARQTRMLDAMIDTRVSFEVSDQEREVIERAERHLLGARPTELAAATSPAASAKGLQQR